MDFSKVYQAIDNDNPDELASSLCELETNPSSKEKVWGLFLHYAVYHLALKTTTYLVHAGVYVNWVDSRGYNPLMVMWLNNKDPHDDRIEAISEFLIKEGADPTQVDDEGMTVLHYACRRGSLKMVRLFLSEGADPDAENRHGLTPVDIIRANIFLIGPENITKFTDLLAGIDR